MRGCLNNVLLLVLILCNTSIVLSGQSAEALKNKRAELLAEINANNRRLGDTRRNKAATVEQLALLQQQIRKRAELNYHPPAGKSPTRMPVLFVPMR